ncbi:MAG: O-antigen ligase family protein [Flavobacteriaceae bacterium]|nr:O-antigen ligase family protein [Flavobacteriaceae bacterium]
MIEIIFSCLILFLPLISLKGKKILPFFLLTFIGANPYITALSLLLSLVTRLKQVIRVNVDKKIFFLLFAWIIYSLFSGLINFLNTVFLSEFIQLVLAVMLLLYIINTIQTMTRLKELFNYFIYSGIILGLLEVVLHTTSIELDTSSFIGSTPENITSFYLLIATIVIPIYYIKDKRILLPILLLGLISISLNQSRLLVILTFFFIARNFISLRNYFVKFFMILGGIAIIYFLYLSFNIQSIYDSNSVYSVVNFENNFSNLERLSMLQYSYDLFMNNSLGHGLGSSASLFINNNYTVIEEYPNPHNTLAFMAVELGFVGVLLYVFFFLTIFKFIIKTKNKNLRILSTNIFISLFLFSIVDVLFYNGVLMLVSFLLMGIVISISKINSNA